MAHWGLQPAPSQLLVDVPVLQRDRQLFYLRQCRHRKAFDYLFVVMKLMMRGWLCDDDGDDDMGCAQSCSSAKLNVYIDGDEGCRAELGLRVGEG